MSETDESPEEGVGYCELGEMARGFSICNLFEIRSETIARTLREIE